MSETESYPNSPYLKSREEPKSTQYYPKASGQLSLKWSELGTAQPQLVFKKRAQFGMLFENGV